MNAIVTRPTDPQFSTSDGSDDSLLAEWHRYAQDLENQLHAKRLDDVARNESTPPKGGAA